MKVVNKAMAQCGGVLASLALLLAVFSANSSCRYILNQPKEPDSLSKFKK